MTAHAKTVRNKCGVIQQGRPAIPYILSGLCPFTPGQMDRWPSGSLYFVNGLNKVYRWNGVRGSFVPVSLSQPSGTPALTSSGSGTIDGDYYCYVRFLDEDGHASPLSTISALHTATDDGTVSYSSLPTPTDPRVVKRQVLRNTAGQTSTFYVDVELTDLWITTATSTKDDDTLAAQEAVALEDDEGNSLTDKWSAPRADKPCIAHARGRMFLAGETVYNRGNAQVTFGSTTVTGIDTNWTDQFANREFMVLGTVSPKAYTISSVDTAAQTLTLSTVYRGTTDLFGSYAIRPPAAQRNTLYYSEADEPNQWPTLNGITIEEAGDAITALIPAASFLYVGFQDALYRLSFDQDPRLDGSAFRVASRGCVNGRTWARVNEAFYVLDRQGVYRLEGDATEEVAMPLHDLWDREAAGEYKIDWSQEKFFHGALDHEDHTLRFYVSLTGPTLPRHAVCYNYVSGAWWIEEYPFPVTCSFYQSKKGRLYVGGVAMKLYEQGVGTSDGLDPSGHTTHGTVSSASIMSLTATSLTLPSSGVAGSPIVITGGTGKGQIRRVESVSSTIVTVTQPWSKIPDSTSTFLIGGIVWRLRTGWYQYPSGEGRSPVEAYFEPRSRGTMDLRIYADHAASATLWSHLRDAKDGIKFSKNDPDLVVNLAKSDGYVRAFLDQPTDNQLHRGDCVSLEARGVTGQEGLRLYGLNIGGAG